MTSDRGVDQSHIRLQSVSIRGWKTVAITAYFIRAAIDGSAPIVPTNSCK